MLTVGRDTRRSSASTQLTSCTQWSTPISRLATASSRRRAAGATIAKREKGVHDWVHPHFPLGDGLVEAARRGRHHRLFTRRQRADLGRVAIDGRLDEAVAK